jgi:hypothetical protein
MRLGIGLGMSSVARRGRGQAAAPTAANLVTRLRADSIVGVPKGATVSSWTDTVNSIVAGTTIGTPPTYSTNRINGKPPVKFVGQDGLSIAWPGALPTAVDTLIFLVFVCAATHQRRDRPKAVSNTNECVASVLKEACRPSW